MGEGKRWSLNVGGKRKTIKRIQKKERGSEEDNYAGVKRNERGGYRRVRKQVRAKGGGRQFNVGKRRRIKRMEKKETESEEDNQE